MQVIMTKALFRALTLRSLQSNEIESFQCIRSAGIAGGKLAHSPDHTDQPRGLARENLKEPNPTMTRRLTTSQCRKHRR